MMVLFDYTFYRIDKFYFEKERRSYSPTTAILYLSILQFFLLYFLFLTSVGILGKAEVVWSGEKNREWVKVVLFVGAIALVLLNHIRYLNKQRIKSFRSNPRFKAVDKYIEPWMFLALGFFLFFFPIFLLGFFL